MGLYNRKTIMPHELHIGYMCACLHFEVLLGYLLMKMSLRCSGICAQLLNVHVFL